MTEVEYINSIKLYEDRVFGFILKQTKNKDLSQEIVQEAFLKLWVNKAKVEILKAKSWLFTTAYNHMINMLKVEGKYDRQTTDNPYNSIDIDYSGIDVSFPHRIENQRNHNTIEDFNRTDIIRAELKKLKIQDRRLIILRDVHGFSYEEIGTKMGLNESQVKVYLFRVRKILKDKFKELSR